MPCISLIIWPGSLNVKNTPVIMGFECLAGVAFDFSPLLHFQTGSSYQKMPNVSIIISPSNFRTTSRKSWAVNMFTG